MAERMTVVVKPVGEQDSLTVEDAMQQVLDVFDLLSSTPSETGQDVVWRLVEAKTSSPPFTVIAEARPLPGVDVDPQVIDRAAREKKQRLAGEFETFKNGHLPAAWQEYRAQRAASDLLERLKHGVIVEISGDQVGTPPIVLTHKDAEIADKVLELPVGDGATTKDQMGSVEGTLIEVTTYWNKPALIIQERKSGARVTCIVNEAQSSEIAQAGTFDDVWKHRRVAVRGLIRYGKLREIKRVDAVSVERKEIVEMPNDSIKDKDFTAGLNAADYLARLREGDIG